MPLLPVRRHGVVVAHTIVDQEDYDRLARHRWRLDRGGYVVRNSGNRHYILHREVLGLGKGDPMCDHRNRDRLDNRRANLRLCTPQGNSENRGPTRSSRSGVRGVSWHAGVGKWQATVWLRGRSYYLGIFDSVEEAGAVAAAFRAEHMPFSEEANAA
jgi:hypothetical protein